MPLVQENGDPDALRLTLRLCYSKPEVFVDSTSWRWKAKNSAIVGIAATVAAAMMRFHVPEYRVWAHRMIGVFGPLTGIGAPVR